MERKITHSTGEGEHVKIAVEKYERDNLVSYYLILTTESGKHVKEIMSTAYKHIKDDLNLADMDDKII